MNSHPLINLASAPAAEECSAIASINSSGCARLNRLPYILPTKGGVK